MSSFALKAPSRTTVEGASATEEEDLLASLNASLDDHSKYESNVLRQATHSLAPQLFDLTAAATTATTTCLTAPDGFPDLSGLGTNDLTVLHTALEETRRKIKHQADKTENDLVRLLYMKEQILLSYLLSLGADLGVCLHEERSNEQARAWLLLQQEHQENECGASSLSVSMLAEKAQPQQTQQRKRIPIMKRKRIEMEGGRNDDKDEEPMALSKEELLTLKQLRQERRRRREARRRQIAQFSSEDNDEEEFLDEEISQPMRNRKDGSTAENNQATDMSASADNSSQSATTVDCPLCKQRVQIRSGLSVEDVDVALSEHMGICQDQRRSTRQRSTRAAAAAATTETFAAASSTSSHRPIRTRNEPNQPQFITTALSAVDDIDESVYEDRIDDWIEHGLDRMVVMKERDDSEMLPGAEEYPGGLFIPEWMNNRLFAYQREGLHWLWELHQQRVGGVIGDEMGLGKTVQASAFLGAAAASRKIRSVLVVAPATMLRHWLSELAVWAPGLRRILIHTSGGEVDGVTRNISTQLLRRLAKWLKQARSNRVNEPIDDDDWAVLEPHNFCGTGYVVVTTYENLRRNADVYTSHDFSYVLLDEAQKIKNPDADITLVCKRMPTSHRLAVSGTPIQNDLQELWSLFDFVFPGRLGTLPVFEQEFAVPIKRGGYSNATPMQSQLAYRCALMLRDLIEPFLLRRLKKDIKKS